MKNKLTGFLAAAAVALIGMLNVAPAAACSGAAEVVSSTTTGNFGYSYFTGGGGFAYGDWGADYGVYQFDLSFAGSQYVVYNPQDLSDTLTVTNDATSGCSINLSQAGTVIATLAPGSHQQFTISANLKIALAP